MTTTVQVGVDIGGTFTDLVARDGDCSITSLKIPSTRGAESQAVRQAIAQLLASRGVEPEAITRFVHGTTVATNAVLERKGARIGLLTTEGFRDVLQIGRQTAIHFMICSSSLPLRHSWFRTSCDWRCASGSGRTGPS
jgi:N-methylhydantoinase A/oxoprolinase/acetone carboxylase beta subunit